MVPQSENPYIETRRNNGEQPNTECSASGHVNSALVKYETGKWVFRLQGVRDYVPWPWVARSTLRYGTNVRGIQLYASNMVYKFYIRKLFNFHRCTQSANQRKGKFISRFPQSPTSSQFVCKIRRLPCTLALPFILYGCLVCVSVYKCLHVLGE